MKFFNKIALAALTVCAMSACTEFADPVYYESADVDFTYNVDGDQYTLDFYVVSTVKFNNTSSKSGNYTWDFGDGTTSNEVSPTHKYETAGQYDVTLTLEGVGSKTYPLMIYDISPVLTVASQTTDIIEFNLTELTFDLELPNPENLTVKYDWTFPEGTTYADGTPVTTFTGYGKVNGSGEYEVEYPEAVKFRNIGSQKVSIITTFDAGGAGERRLSDAFLNVQVGCSEPAQTLYYAQRGGNIKAMKILENIPEGTKVMPYDLGVSSGSTVFNLLCNSLSSVDEETGETVSQDWIYILDAGKQYYYVNDENGVLGDGLMTAMKADGTGVNTVVTNVGGPAFSDPFRGFIKEGTIYYSDRNTGFSSISCTDRGTVQGITLSGSTYQRASYVMTNSNTPFYGQGIAYGAITCGLYKDAQGWWWVGKNFNGQGIFRAQDDDIYASIDGIPIPSQILLSGEFMSTFAVDEARGQFYIWRTSPAQSFQAYPIVGPQQTVTTKDALVDIAADCTPENTTAAEGMYVTQMAIDNETGKVYFCFRPEATDKSGIAAGIAVYDPATQKITNYGSTSDLATGIVINPNKTKLF